MPQRQLDAPEGGCQQKHWALACTSSGSNIQWGRTLSSAHTAPCQMPRSLLRTLNQARQGQARPGKARQGQAPLKAQSGASWQRATAGATCGCSPSSPASLPLSSSTRILIRVYSCSTARQYSANHVAGRCGSTDSTGNMHMVDSAQTRGGHPPRFQAKAKPNSCANIDCQRAAHSLTTYTASLST